MKKTINIYCVVKHIDGDDYHLSICVELPFKDFVKELDLSLSDEEISSVSSLAEKLNNKNLGFKLYIKVK